MNVFMKKVFCSRLMDGWDGVQRLSFISYIMKPLVGLWLWLWVFNGVCFFVFLFFSVFGLVSAFEFMMLFVEGIHHTHAHTLGYGRLAGYYYACTDKALRSIELN